MQRKNTPSFNRILTPVRKSLLPTKIEILQNPGTHNYQWWGNNGHAYSAAHNTLSVVVNMANSLSKR